MRWTTLALMTTALICAMNLVDASPIIYDVNISDGTETVAGTITTNGTLGSLHAGDFTGFSLSAIGPIAFGPITPGSVDCFFSACSIIATPTTLTVSVFGSPTDLTRFPIGRVEFDAGSVGVLSFGIGGYNINNVIAPYVIGRLAIPEPATGTLVGVALACLCFVCRRLPRRPVQAREHVALC